MVVGQTHVRGGTLDLLMTDIFDLVRAAVVAPKGNSYQASISAVIPISQAVPNLLVGKFSFNIKSIRTQYVVKLIQDLPWRNIRSSDNPVVVLTCWFDVMYQPRLSVCTTGRRIDDQCRRAFGLMQEAHLRWPRDLSWVNSNR